MPVTIFTQKPNFHRIRQALKCSRPPAGSISLRADDKPISFQVALRRPSQQEERARQVAPLDYDGKLGPVPASLGNKSQRSRQATKQEMSHKTCTMGGANLPCSISMESGS